MQFVNIFYELQDLDQREAPFCVLNHRSSNILHLPKIMEIEKSGVEAVFIGALAPGVNGPTWNTLKTAFLMLGLCLASMLGLAFSCSDFTLTLHITFLVLISGTLFFLLSSFLAQTGLVSVEDQMQEIGLAPKNDKINKVD